MPEFDLDAALAPQEQWAVEIHGDGRDRVTGAWLLYRPNDSAPFEVGHSFNLFLHVWQRDRLSRRVLQTRLETACDFLNRLSAAHPDKPFHEATNCSVWNWVYELTGTLDHPEINAL